ncbi:MAG: hypothetical protein KGO81_09165 [Bacteroidota bacterium]|nr:hypothetical protein [Bacteroidota bacterium]
MELVYYNQARKQQPAISSDDIKVVGLALPYQPSIWSDTKLNSVLNYAKELLQVRLKERGYQRDAERILLSVDDAFSRLNKHTHRKSIIVRIANNVEQIVYLNYEVKPAIWFSESISIFDIAMNIRKEPAFFLLTIECDQHVLYSYNDDGLKKIYQHRGCPTCFSLHHPTIVAVQLLNSQHHLPVFILSKCEDKINAFLSLISFPELVFRKMITEKQYDVSVVERMAAGIAADWYSWNPQVLLAKIILKKKTHACISGVAVVLSSLQKGGNGFLLIDERLMQLLKKPKGFALVIYRADVLMNEIEKFVTRGNAVEVTALDLLADEGGIVLLKDIQSAGDYSLVPSKSRHSIFDELLF